MRSEKVAAILGRKFDTRHVGALLKHFLTATEKFAIDDWDGVATNAGKFVEAVAKSLMVSCGKPIGPARKFKAGNELRQLESVGTAPDTLRIVLPKACLFIYEIANNRGGRHDADEIESNVIDSNVIVQTMSWVLAEMVRFAAPSADVHAANAIISELSEKRFPYLESIGGRPYVNIPGLSAREVALLLLYFSYPSRMSRLELIKQVSRHGTTKHAAEVAVHRLRSFVDDSNNDWQLRGLGRQAAETILKKSAALRNLDR